MDRVVEYFKNKMGLLTSDGRLPVYIDKLTLVNGTRVGSVLGPFSTLQSSFIPDLFAKNIQSTSLHRDMLRACRSVIFWLGFKWLKLLQIISHSLEKVNSSYMMLYKLATVIQMNVNASLCSSISWFLYCILNLYCSRDSERNLPNAVLCKQVVQVCLCQEHNQKVLTYSNKGA